MATSRFFGGCWAFHLLFSVAVLLTTTTTVAAQTAALTVLDDSNFKDAIKIYSEDVAVATADFGPIEAWDTSRVTDMSSLELPPDFNPDISAWNVAAVTTMAEVRSGCTFCFLGRFLWCSHLH